MWTVRRAKEPDAAALVDLCRESVGPDDYVPAFMDAFLRTGVVFLAEASHTPVGMMVYHDVPDGSVWLHAARTHPAWRQQGVATGLVSACENLARERRRSALRLWAAASNVASVTANRRYGFEERARFTRMRIPASPMRPVIRLEPVDLAKHWPRLESSPLLRAARGYLFHDFYFVPLTRSNAEWLIRDGALLRWESHVVAVSEDFEDASGRDLQIQGVAGDPGAFLRAAPGIAAARGADRVETFLPHEPRLLKMARQAGYTFMDWGQEAVVFEKPLPGNGT